MDTPLIVIVAIFKNEESVVEKTLLPFAKSGIKDFLILDTGSTDSTVEKTKHFFLSNQLNGVLKEDKFIDFSTSRNQALEYAEKYFCEATFLLMIDADWFLNNPKGMINFCLEQRAKAISLYNIYVHFGHFVFASARLFRRESKIRYIGPVHEVPDTIADANIPENIFFSVTNDQAHSRKSRQRFKRDSIILLKEFKKEPLNPRTLFYLAQTYECLNQTQNAFNFYFKRSLLAQICLKEDNALVFYRLGYLTENLSIIDKKFTWEMALEFYHEAYKICSERIEPMVAIAAHYLEKFPKISFVYLKHIYNSDLPKNKMVFLEKNIYEYVRYDLMSACAWTVQEYTLGLEATEKALKVKPNHPVLVKRLNMYREFLKTKNQEKNMNYSFQSSQTFALI